MLLAGVARAQTEFRPGPDGRWAPASPAPEPGSDGAVMQEARRLLAEGRASRAEDLLDEWLDLNERSENPFLAEAYLLRGNAKLAQDDEWDALYDYETVIRQFPGSEAYVEAVQREVEIGKAYLDGRRKKFWGLFRIENAEPEGEELLIRAQQRLPQSALAEDAGVTLADWYYRERDLPMAAEMYDILLRNYPQSRFREHAMQRRIFSNIARFKGPRYNAQPLIEARVFIEDYARRFPTEAARAGLSDALVSRLDESAAAQMLETARWYLKREDDVSARFTLRRLLRNHPGTVAAARAEAMMRERGWITDVVPAGGVPGDGQPTQAGAEGVTPITPDGDERGLPRDGAVTPRPEPTTPTAVPSPPTPPGPTNPSAGPGGGTSPAPGGVRPPGGSSSGRSSSGGGR
jgi:outer membrane protein assembly factor BamD (BamD/ComL family)